MNDVQAVIDRLAVPALQVLVVAVAAYVVLRLSQRFVSRLLIRTMEHATDDPGADAIARAEATKRVDTLTSLVDWLLRLVIIGAAAVAILAVFDLTPVIVVVAIVLAAVFVVAQDVIRDYIGGAIIVLENQFGIGDSVQVAGMTGQVESVSLRRTTLRGDHGEQITVPNGIIRIAVNETRIWGMVRLVVTIADPGRVDDARAAIDRVGREMKDDPSLGPSFLEPLAFLRVDTIDATGVGLLAVARVRAADRWDLTGEARRRVLAALAEAGVPVVIAQRVEVVGAPDGTLRA